MNRRKGALMGALVADAAALGLHWLYDQERIAEIGGGSPEFRAPNRPDYRNALGEGLGYYAHGGKRPGEPSHYGAQMLAMADALAVEDGSGYHAIEYARSFRAWFGYGGKWRGYTDRPTRATLDAMARAEAEDAAAPLTDCGADDAQLPAISKLPPLIVRHHSESALPAMVESAVRVTNDRDDAAAWGAAAAAMIGAALDGAAPEDAALAARGVSAEINAQIAAALDMRGASSEEAARAFDLHCQLEAAFPVIVHLIVTATGFKAATRANIRAGGDSCGRAILMGAVLGACFAGEAGRGVPADWAARVQAPGALAALF